MTHRDDDPLIAIYMARRSELLRYFRIRLRSAEAAEDLVQDIYLKLMKRQQEDIGNPGAYLYRLGTNLMLDRIKLERRVQRRAAAWGEVYVASGGGAEAASSEPMAYDVLESRQRLEQIVNAVKRLSPAAQKAFRLHKLQGLSHAETAEAMGISRSSVEKHLMAALKLITEQSSS